MDASEKSPVFSRPLGYAIAAGVLLLVAAGLFWVSLARQNGPEETEPVFGGAVWRSGDQKGVAAALAKAGLSDYSWNHGRLIVPATKRVTYEKILGESQALPKSPSEIKSEAISAMSLFEPESKTRLRERDASSRELEATLEQFESVESATVGVNTRRETEGLQTRLITTASIGIQTKEETPLTPELLAAITRGAKNHLGIIDDEHISILDFRQGRSFSGSVSPNPTDTIPREDRAAWDNPNPNEQSVRESVWREKFQNACAHIPGIRVALSVEFVRSASVLSEKEIGAAPPPTEKFLADTTPALSLGNRSAVAAGTLMAPIAEGDRVEPQSWWREQVTVSLAVPESLLTGENSSVRDELNQIARRLLAPVFEASESHGLRFEERVQIVSYPETGPETVGEWAVVNYPSPTLPDSTNKQTTKPATEPTVRAETTDTEATDSDSWAANGFVLWTNAATFIKANPSGSMITLGILVAMILGVGIGIARRRNVSRHSIPEAESLRRDPNERGAEEASDDFIDELVRIRHPPHDDLRRQIVGHIDDDPRRAAEILNEWMKAGA